MSLQESGYLFDFLKKCECKNEKLYRKIVEAIRSSLDINQTKKTIINVIGQALSADRCFIIEYDKKNDIFERHQEEYLSSDSIKSCVDIDLNTNLPVLVNWLKQGKLMIHNHSKAKLGHQEINLTDNQFKAEKSIVEEYKIYSGVVFPIFYANEFLGDIVLHYSDKEHEVGEEEMSLLQILSGQLSIALHQSRIFEKMKIQNEIQTTILNNIPFMAWLKDVDGKYIMVNKKMAESYGTSQDEMIGKGDFDYTPDFAEKYVELDSEVMKTKETKIIQEPIMNKGKRRWSETFKSPIIDSKGNVLGTAGLAHDITDRKESELELIKRQEKIIAQAQREKINRNIIEILRSSLDKAIIKKQFVRNIGKFFNADRVFFSEYDSKNKIYLPVDENSEYLSSEEEKSFINFDWTSSCVQEHIQPLLEKREVNIYNWQEYISHHPEKCRDFISLFEEANVKSSYNFPVLHQTDIIGYFCIEFTQKVFELSDEDMLRIRSICTQAAVALYQADLYMKAQNAISLKNEFISKTISGAKTILNNIVELSTAMEGHEKQCEKHIEHLDHIKENIILLLDLIKDVNMNVD